MVSNRVGAGGGGVAPVLWEGAGVDGPLLPAPIGGAGPGAVEAGGGAPPAIHVDYIDLELTITIKLVN